MRTPGSRGSLGMKDGGSVAFDSRDGHFLGATSSVDFCVERATIAPRLTTAGGRCIAASARAGGRKWRSAALALAAFPLVACCTARSGGPNRVLATWPLQGAGASRRRLGRRAHSWHGSGTALGPSVLGSSGGYQPRLLGAARTGAGRGWAPQNRRLVFAGAEAHSAARHETSGFAIGGGSTTVSTANATHGCPRGLAALRRI